MDDAAGCFMVFLFSFVLSLIIISSMDSRSNGPSLNQNQLNDLHKQVRLQEEATLNEHPIKVRFIGGPEMETYTGVSPTRTQDAERGIIVLKTTDGKTIQFPLDKVIVEE